MRILVTGGAGFIGSALCRHLVGERGDQVLAILQSGKEDELRDVLLKR